MAGKSAVLTVKILSDASGAGKGIDQATGKFAKFESGISKLTPAATAIAGGLAIMGTKAVNAASDVQQAMGGIDAVFGKNGETVKKWAAGAATAVGLSKAEYGSFATVIGSQLKNAGLPMDEVMDKTNGLITLGADLAATYGGTTADAVDALSAALKGEFDPMERYGATLSASAISAKMAADGTDKLTGKAGKQAKAMATLELITGQTKDAQGQFARESDTLAGAQQKANATFQNAAADLGTALLPAVTSVTTAFTDMANWVAKNSTVVLALGGVLGGLAASVLAINVALKAYRATATAVAAVQKVMATAALGTRIQLAALAVQQKAVAAGAKIASIATTAWSTVQRVATVVSTAFGVAARAAWAALTGPIGLVVIAITAVIAIVVALWNKNKAFRDFVKAAWAAIANAAKVAWEAIKTAVVAVVNWIKSAVSVMGNVVKLIWMRMKNAAANAWNGIKSAVMTVVNWIKSAANVMGNAVKLVWMRMKNAAANAWNGIKSAVMTVVNWIKSATNVMGNAVKLVWMRIKNSAATAWNGVKNAVKTVRDWIKGAFDTVKTKISDIWSKIKSAFDRAFNPIRTTIDRIKSAFDNVVDAVKSVVDWIGRIKMPSISWPKPPAWVDKLFSAPLPPPPSPSAPMVGPATFAAGAGLTAGGGRRRSTASVGGDGGGGGVVININGGLDSADTIARRIEKLLTDRARRTGGAVTVLRA